MIGKTVNHYKVTAKLGEGGMGEVYLAEDTKLDRKIALKFLPESLSHDTVARERLLREAKAASKLSHSNIVTIHAVEQSEGHDFIAMEYVDGRPLDEYLQEKPRTINEILRVAVQLARGLDQAHKAGVVHRDLKPGNIFIDREDRVRILDFGLALVQGTSKLTQTGSTLGTIAYMSPEQIEGKDADPRSDVFSFGILLYEMLAGRSPFSGDHHAALMYSILNEAPEPVEATRPDTPVGLAAIVARALQKDPLRRYPSATELLGELRRERDTRTGTSTPTPASSPEIRRRLPRFVIPAALIAVVAVVALVIRPWKIEFSPTQEVQAVDDRLAIMYFDNVVQPDDPQRYGEIASNLLIADLSESQHMQIVSNQRLYDILKLLGREGQKTVDRDIATKVAEKAQARWMLLGSILQTTPHFVITAQIVETETGTAVASQVIEGKDGESIFSLVGQLAHAIAGDLAIPEPNDASTALRVDATKSADAYRHYLNGIDYERQFYNTRAEQEFRQAIEIDTTFALAYLKLYGLTVGSREDAETWLNKAKQYADRLGRRDRMYVDAAIARREQGRTAQIEILQQMLEEFPDDTEVLTDLSGLLAWRNRYEEALALLDRRIALDSLDKLAYNSMAYIYDEMGEGDKALRAIDRYIELAPNEANPYDSRGDLYCNQGKFAEAMRSFHKAVELNPDFFQSQEKLGYLQIMTGDYAAADSSFTALTKNSSDRVRSIGRVGFAVIQSHQGRFRRAVQALDEGMAADRMEQYAGFPYLNKRWMKAAMLEGLGSRDEAIRIFTECYEQCNELIPWSCISMLGVLADIEMARGNTRGADSLMDELYRVIEVSDTTRIGFYLYARARLALHYGDTTEMRTRVDSLLQRFDLFSVDSYIPQMVARAYLKLTQPADAIPIMERLLYRRFDILAVKDPFIFVTLHYDLGRAYEMSGWTKKAIQEYERFLAIWHDPDPELKDVQDARDRLAKLRAAS
jgi:serine/threonine protein kinase/tetratricopeptide (TPR) repeat protein